MSVREVCDLSSLLTGDDSEADGLERKLAGLQASILHQERRLQQEEESRLREESVDRRTFNKGSDLVDHLEFHHCTVTQALTTGEFLEKYGYLSSRICDFEGSRNAIEEELDDIVRHLDDAQNLLEVLQGLSVQSFQVAVARLHSKKQSIQERLQSNDAQQMTHRNSIVARELQLAHKSNLIPSLKNDMITISASIVDYNRKRSAIVSQHEENKSAHSDSLAELIAFKRTHHSDSEAYSASLEESQRRLEEFSRNFQTDCVSVQEAEALNDAAEARCKSLSSHLGIRQSTILEFKLILEHESAKSIRLEDWRAELVKQLSEETYNNIFIKKRENELTEDASRLETELQSQVDMLEAISNQIEELKSEIDDFPGEPGDRKGYLLEEIGASASKKAKLESDLQAMLLDQIVHRRQNDKCATELSVLNSQIELLSRERSEAHDSLEILRRARFDLDASMIGGQTSLDLEAELKAVGETKAAQLSEHHNSESAYSAAESLLADVQQNLLVAQGERDRAEEKLRNRLYQKEKQSRLSEYRDLYHADREKAVIAAKNECSLEDSRMKELWWASKQKYEKIAAAKVVLERETSHLTDELWRTDTDIASLEKDIQRVLQDSEDLENASSSQLDVASVSGK